MVRVMNSNTTGEINLEIIQERLYSPDTTQHGATRCDAPGVYDDAQVSSLIRVFLRNL